MPEANDSSPGRYARECPESSHRSWQIHRSELEIALDRSEGDLEQAMAETEAEQSDSSSVLVSESSSESDPDEGPSAVRRCDDDDDDEFKSDTNDPDDRKEKFVPLPKERVPGSIPEDVENSDLSETKDEIVTVRRLKIMRVPSQKYSSPE
ncbi:hypothetical protein NDU88_006135 [Pleurodeles waltl]|uniref:Uncharacterized protein n=1 Tax=Pleurodeles waltl TaxID=8319 RepID=A0AAV7RKR3_PLEWA|nr:hypothetical protein NDU88_006135 [Pleurodeles waltl]